MVFLRGFESEFPVATEKGATPNRMFSEETSRGRASDFRRNRESDRILLGAPLVVEEYRRHAKRISGEVAERLKAYAWKVYVRETVPGVRIPPSPPFSINGIQNKLFLFLQQSEVSASTAIAARS